MEDILNLIHLSSQKLLMEVASYVENECVT